MTRTFDLPQGADVMIVPRDATHDGVRTDYLMRTLHPSPIWRQGEHYYLEAPTLQPLSRASAARVRQADDILTVLRAQGAPIEARLHLYEPLARTGNTLHPTSARSPFFTLVLLKKGQEAARMTHARQLIHEVVPFARPTFLITEESHVLSHTRGHEGRNLTSRVFLSEKRSFTGDYAGRPPGSRQSIFLNKESIDWHRTLVDPDETHLIEELAAYARQLQVSDHPAFFEELEHHGVSRTRVLLDALNPPH